MEDALEVLSGRHLLCDNCEDNIEEALYGREEDEEV